jgi:copper oxidase (laccase) domain-containing protein
MRGTSLDIAGKAVRMMREVYGCNPADFIAVIGPSIMPCHFLTDNDVPDAMTARFGAGVSPYIEKKGEKWAVDLPGINSHALMREGVSENNITLSNLCSACNTDEFFSHRIMGFSRGVCAAVISL